MFAKQVIYLSTSIKLGRYIQAACKNWDNYNLDNAANPDNKYKDDKDDENKYMGGRPPENPNKLYEVYN